MSDQELFYHLALQKIDGVGAIIARQLLMQYGSAEAIFKKSIKELANTNNIGEKKARAIKATIDEKAVEREMNFISKHKIDAIGIKENNYPHKLKEIPDAPILIYQKGKIELNNTKNIGIVGTRKPSEYGKDITQKIIEEIAPFNPTIISGMAYGIDIIAHRKSVELSLPTIGVLAHGLDLIYPSMHKSTAQEMIKNGGLLTEYPSGTNPDKQNFPMRNRIVAGICDLVLVVESDVKGGAMITAKLAAEYNREVGAIPGRTIDEKSNGCNYLIKTNIAHLVESGEDIATLLNWDIEKKASAQARLFTDLSDQEMKIVDIIKEKDQIHIDDLMLKSGVAYSSLANILLSLELLGVLKSLSGKRYSLKL